jgi:hypothetical protein
MSHRGDSDDSSAAFGQRIGGLMLAHRSSQARRWRPIMAQERCDRIKKNVCDDHDGRNFFIFFKNFSTVENIVIASRSAPHHGHHGGR